MKLRAGNRLLSAREDKRLNQKEMADLLGISQSAYSRFERNENSADIEQIVNFSKILEIPVQEFLPETMAIHHSNNDNGQVGFVIGNFNNYGSRESEQENVFLKEKISLLEQRIAGLERENELLRMRNL